MGGSLEDTIPDKERKVLKKAPLNNPTVTLPSIQRPSPHLLQLYSHARQKKGHKKATACLYHQRRDGTEEEHPKEEPVDDQYRHLEEEIRLRDENIVLRTAKLDALMA